ncbi:PDR/VanB family oxidoreductase [Pseudomonas viridiflava]|nr:PDR/VanB family oxidoreductase [Pseudomonas viridiflava]
MIELSHRNGSDTPPEAYLIAVRLDEKGRGGSRYMHETLKVGDIIEITSPRNDFPMRDSGGRAFLIAGGIGVTPLASMAATCRFHGREVKMVYAGRDRASMALIDELQVLLGDRLFIHADTEVGAPMDIRRLFDQFNGDDDIHICGPTPLLDAMIAEAERRGWARDRLNFELFAPAVSAEGDTEFDIILASSERKLRIPVGKSILEVLIEEGCDPMFDCKRGECGVCSTGVIAGEVDHRDYVLTERERAANNVMYPAFHAARVPSWFSTYELMNSESDLDRTHSEVRARPTKSAGSTDSFADFSLNTLHAEPKNDPARTSRPRSHRDSHSDRHSSMA